MWSPMRLTRPGAVAMTVVTPVSPGRSEPGRGVVGIDRIDEHAPTELAGGDEPGDARRTATGSRARGAPMRPASSPPSVGRCTHQNKYGIDGSNARWNRPRMSTSTVARPSRSASSSDGRSGTRSTGATRT